MSENKLLIGKNIFQSGAKEVTGQFVTIDGEEFYEIRNYDSMQPFFMSLASDSDHWMFISSTGGLSAGRINPESALFPYYTDDKLQESAETTGSKSIFRIWAEGATYLWEPFTGRYEGVYKTERNIYKNTVGNKLIFEEKNLDLGLTFRYGWMNSDKYGWIKKSILENNLTTSVEVELIDGLQNLLPYGVDRFMQNQFSTLLDGYKKSELVKDYSLGLFRLESIPVDKAEPSEAMQVVTVWTSGLEKNQFLLSSRQLGEFRKGNEVIEEKESKGVKGAFFTNNVIKLAAKEKKVWYFVAEVNQDSVKVNNLVAYLEKTGDKIGDLEKNIQEGTHSLKAIVADADGIQNSADKLVVSRHFSNVLFNVMRGGIFSDGYAIDKTDFLKHIGHFNKQLREDHREFFGKLPSNLNYSLLDRLISNEGSEDLYRLFLEYLPLTFSRRHGDPSRPWNVFSINIKDSVGNKLLYYQGNWRDIFQNWEALALSYPGYISGMIAKFVNASSADGYNPYRVTRDGIDWEVPEPDNPFSNIGYWGDHQIIYMLKLLEVSKKYFPGRLDSWLSKDMFAYANIPYRIKSYNEIVNNPHDSIVFNFDLHHKIEETVAKMGADGKLLLDKSGKVFRVNMTEKILAPLLSKLSNFIPEAGIWMNTLRPEWNDANNALVGYGVSMVTLYYMRRFIHFMIELFSASDISTLEITEEMADLFRKIDDAFKNHQSKVKNGFNDKERKMLVDQLGTAGSDFRNKIYKGFSGKRTPVKKQNLIDFFKTAQAYIDQSIAVNKRTDKLYNAYNLLTISDDEYKIRYLYEMLEGQVSVLSSGKLSPEEALEVLDSLRKSKLYREDQESYILYPDKRLPWFLEKNIVPEEDVKKTPVLLKLIEIGDNSVIAKDIRGQYHFSGTFRNAGHLKKALQKLNDTAVIRVSDSEIKSVMAIYEKIFDHQSFTGRSGTFYKYEGLGSIYWHMVSKLLVAIGENIELAQSKGASRDILQKLAKHYAEVQKGIGVHKTPDKYGAFPTDPYSHTPCMSGVQQPGMTGQVKEDIISRFFELGLIVNNGQISFSPAVLKKSEFIQPRSKDSYDQSVPHLYFTYCKVPIIYLFDGKEEIDLVFDNGSSSNIQGLAIDKKNSQSIFRREGEISKIYVHLKSVNGDR
jgi:hypothetical protein